LELLRAVGLVYESAKEVDKVIEIFDECYTRSRRVLGVQSTITLLAMADLGGRLIERAAPGDRERARALLTECLEVSTKLRGPKHPGTLTVMFILGNLYSTMGDFGAAESTLSKARDAAASSLPADHPYITRFDLGLAEVYAAQGRHDESRELLIRAVAQLRATLGDDNPITLTAVNMLAAHYTAMGQHDQAAKVKAGSGATPSKPAPDGH
jgi:tetratricopeptide (TPR) repeat protein